VVCVTPGDAQAYVAWRSQVEGRVVRLPRAEELLAALRPKGRPFWGEQSTELCRYANLADRPRPHAPEAPHCGDAYPGLAPVGRFAPDAAGRFDLAGNAAELTATCNAGDQATSAASSLAGCRVWKVLGGSYESLPEEIDPAHPIARETGHLQWDDANVLTGFRVFREPVR
jgi:formylglycine-generating enzyme required for sulfatase activity